MLLLPFDRGATGQTSYLTWLTYRSLGSTEVAKHDKKSICRIYFYWL